MIADSGFIMPMRTRVITDEIAHKTQNVRLRPVKYPTAQIARFTVKQVSPMAKLRISKTAKKLGTKLINIRNMKSGELSKDAIFLMNLDKVLL